MSFTFGNTSAFSATPTATGFGATAAKPTAFGAPMTATTAAPSFGLGTAGTTTTGFNAFGTAPSTGFGSTAPSFGGFGTFATSAPATGFSFGSTVSSAPNTGFSFGPTTTTSSSFGGFGNFGTTQNPSAFATNTTGFGGFGSNFGVKPTTGFGLTAPSTFGAPQQQAVDPNAAFYESILNCQVFGDERDNTLRRWNLLQALYGFGKGFYNQQAPPVDYDMKNPFCRFKAVAYSARPSYENKDGCVAFVFSKKEEEIRTLETQIITNITNILGNKPNLAVSLESIQPMSDTKTIVLVSVQEKSANGTVRKIPAQELATFFLQPMTKQQLTNLQVENLYPHIEFSAEQLREYLETPPTGFDAEIWQQAQDDNPLPERLIPVPVVGFNEVRWRVKCQETEANMQQACLEKMSEEMADLQRKHTTTVANIAEYKSRLVELQHRILKIVILQEKSRKMGMTLSPDEEVLNSRLQALESTINSTSFKNRLTALSEGVKSLENKDNEPQRYKLDQNIISDIKQFLQMSQSGINHIIETLQTDLAEMKIIKDGMTRLLQRPL